MYPQVLASDNFGSRKMRPVDKVCTAVSKLSWFSSTSRTNSTSSSSPTSFTEMNRAQCRALDASRKSEYHLMLEGNGIVAETDMRRTMQQDALHLASKALDMFDVTEATDISRFIKKEFDRSY